MNITAAVGQRRATRTPGSRPEMHFTLISRCSLRTLITSSSRRSAAALPFSRSPHAPLAGTAGIAINRIRISDYGTGSSSDGSLELFFDNLTISGPDSIPGDFNNDNIVDAADYVVWRKNGLDAVAFNEWRAHFGATASTNAWATKISPVRRPRAERQHPRRYRYCGYLPFVSFNVTTRCCDCWLESI